jgi:RimJ/RimL family protein N-acetyltransferase
LRAVESGSWLGRAHPGKGIGTEMRAAALHLAFTGHGALIARSGAFDDNRRSLGVSRALGYEDDGDAEYLRGDPGMAGRILRLKLTRERWEQHRPDLDVTVEHLEPCLPLLGVTP